MKISIVTPTYNSANYVRDTLESIHSQSYKNFEHIVADGLSKDNTTEIVKSYTAIRLVSEKDRGQSDALNKGFRMATGDILAWQNADDLYCEGAFQKVIDFFQANPTVDIVYGHYQLIDSDGKLICNVYPIEWNQWMFAHGRFVPLQPTVFWRRRVADAIGPLNEDLHYCMDVDFFSKAAVKGFKFARIPQILGQFRVHQQSKTQNSVNDRKVKSEHRQVLADNFGYNAFDHLIFSILHARAKVGKFVKGIILKK
jgi:glycosyltransferase involved in cell wall biosynthesis